MIRWRVPKMWKDSECWIIGGGTSVPEMFGVPHQIIQNVLDKKGKISDYSEYMTELHDKHVIGVNMSYQLGHWISALYFGDRSFFRRQKHGISEFKNLKITHSNLTSRDREFHKDIRWLKSMPGKYGISPNPRQIYWNQNSGASAINVAAHAGVKRILLLGFDMNLNQVGKSHWHRSYGNYVINEKTFKRFLKGFPKIAEDAKKMGIEILNVNPNSAIDAFKKVELRDIL